MSTLEGAVRKNSAVLATFLVALVAAGCHSLPGDPGSPLRASLRESMPPLVSGRMPVFLTTPGDFKSYWDRFGGRDPEFPWSWSRLSTPSQEVGVLVVPPAQDHPPEGVILFFHGYLSHSGNFLELFRFLREQGWWVVASDLPGHGLSGPEERGGIGSFTEYGEAVAQVAAWVESLDEWKDLPRVGMGHSTGASALMVFHQAHQDSLDGLVLSAPLLHSWMYGPSDAASWFFGPVISYLPSAESGDPLGVPYVPLRWFRALAEWNRLLPHYKPQSLPLLLLTGNRDHVVETDYNIPQVTRLYPVHKLVVFDGLDHSVLQDSRFRQEVFGEILLFLGKFSKKIEQNSSR